MRVLTEQSLIAERVLIELSPNRFLSLEPEFADQLGKEIRAEAAKIIAHRNLERLLAKPVFVPCTGVVSHNRKLESNGD